MTLIDAVTKVLFEGKLPVEGKKYLELKEELKTHPEYEKLRALWKSVVHNVPAKDLPYLLGRDSFVLGVMVGQSMSKPTVSASHSAEVSELEKLFSIEPPVPGEVEKEQ